MKVLYVEDNPVDVDLTRRHLERHAPHIRMDAIYSVADFFELLNRQELLASYSVMLLDYRLPQENALEIVKRVKQSANTEIPIILVTGKGDEEIAVKALKLGVFDFVTKGEGYLFKIPSIIENAHYSMRLSREHEALLESEKRYRSLFENNHVAMMLVDPENGEIVDANTAAVSFYGWSQEQMKTKQIHEINILDKGVIEKEMANAVAEKRNHFLFKHRLADGSIRDVEVYSGPIDFSGRSLLYSIVYDITERLQTERDKEKLQKMLIQAQKMESFGQLAGGIAHDFNNLLSSILGFTELTINQAEKGSAIERDLHEVYAAGIRAKELVGQILAFARQTDDEVKPLRIGAITREVLKLIRSSTPSTIEIIQALSSKASILGNAVQIHQIIMNLCTNAIHAMEKDGGVLKIGMNEVSFSEEFHTLGRTLKAGKYIELTVSDSGLGIPEENLATIFEPYYTTKPPGEGTGMGLAMVYGIVERYAGGINVKSVLAKGTTFTLYFPITEMTSEKQIFAPEKLPPGDEHILFVDDEPPVAKVGQRMLKGLGYTVTAMTSSTDALEHFRANHTSYDLVITDMTMPKLTGDKLAIEMMKIRPDIPVVLCTGYSKKVTDESVLQFGIKALIEKPIVKADLAKTIRKVLDEADS